MARWSGRPPLRGGRLAPGTAIPGTARKLRLLPILVLVLSSTLLLAWWRSLDAPRDRLIQQRFDAAARRVATKISERLDAYDEMLRGAAGLFAASEQVSRREFERYVERLRLGTVYSGVQGIGFAAVVPAGGVRPWRRRFGPRGSPPTGSRRPAIATP